MKTRLIRIGKHRGIRLPASLIRKAGLRDAVELSVVDNQIIITSQPSPRAGWAEAIAKAIKEHGEEPIDHEWLDFPNEFDKAEWTW